ncbi:MAG: hypothetical protein SCM96_05375 [Acidobacteriota bacterium]|nr:hypothetical protein [Acidobacteriota bacterium]
MVLSRWRVLVFAAAAGLILHFAVPPFHNPDEPQHFSIVVRKAWGDEKKDEIERGIIEMMDRAGWWRMVGMGQPEVLPRNLADIRFISRRMEGDIKDLHRGLLLYHRTAAMVVGPLAGKNLERLYVLNRAFSYALFMAALLVLYGALQAVVAGRRREDEPDASAAVARGEPLNISEGAPLLFVLFLPQLLMIALSTGSDAWCIFLGAVFFRSAFAVIRGEAGGAAVVGLFGATVAGVLSDHSVLVFAPLAVVASLFAFKWNNPVRSVLIVLSFALGILVVAFVLVQVFPLEVERNFIYLKARVTGSLNTFGTGMDSLFFSRLAESFFLRFGWMGFGAPRTVLWGWKISGLVASFGIVFLFIRTMVRRMRGRGPMLKVLAFAALAAVVQALLTRLATTSPEVMYAQGRYLFPMLLPIALLFVTGFREFFDSVERGAAGISRLARSVFGRRADKINFSESDAKGSCLSGGVAEKEARGVRDGQDGFFGLAGRGGGAALSDEKTWEAPGDALVPIGPRPPRLGEWAVTAFLIAELLVLGYAVWALIIPAFHLTRSTPIPGI